MQRIHMHISVADLAQSIDFYSTLFDAAPSVRKPDYAKWSLADPALNLAISTGACGGAAGIDHVGIEAEDAAELATIAGRLRSAGEPVVQQSATQCCYAVSDKTWAEDPSGVRWESFYTHGESAVYGEDSARRELEAARAGLASGASVVKD